MDFNKEVDKYLRQSKEGFNRKGNPDINTTKSNEGLKASAESNELKERKEMSMSNSGLDKEKDKEISMNQVSKKEKNMFLDDDDEDLVNIAYKRNHDQTNKIDEENSEDDYENDISIGLDKSTQNKENELNNADYEENENEEYEDDDLDDEIDDLLRRSFVDLNKVKNEIK